MDGWSAINGDETMNFKEAICIVKDKNAPFGDKVDANVYLHGIEYETVELGTVCGEPITQYKYPIEDSFSEVCYFFCGDFRTVSEIVECIDHLFETEDLFQISKTVREVFGKYSNHEQLRGE